MTAINWMAPATVTLFTRQSAYDRGKKLYEGTLAGAVRIVMGLPAERRSSARIFTDKAVAKTEHSFFSRADIEELAGRPDFPDRTSSES